MGFRASPHPIPNLPSDDGIVIWDIGGIFNVSDAHLAKEHFSIHDVPINHYIIGLDVRMDDALFVQCSNASKRISQDSLHYGKRDIVLNERKQVVFVIFIGKHGLVRDRVVSHTNVRAPLKIAEHVLEIGKVILRHTFEHILLVTSSEKRN